LERAAFAPVCFVVLRVFFEFAMMISFRPVTE
jgi:hypothetical protein